MKHRALIAAWVLLSLTATAQQGDPRGIHQIESEQHRFDTAEAPETSAFRPTSLAKRSTALSRKVLGWHPYWASSTAYLSYDYAALTHIAYFSYETDTATGGYKTIRSWLSTPIIDYAHQRGVKVLLTVTNFEAANNSALLSDTNKQNFMITTLIVLLKQRSGDGVNFDLESVPASQRTNLALFMQRADRIRREVPGAEISMAAPAVDWSNAWDLASLGQSCDQLVIMGYNYYFSGSSTAGPVAPLTGESYSITRSVDTYLNQGVPASRLMLGLPWYGYDWPVADNARKSARVGSRGYGTSRTYTAMQGILAGVAAQDRFYDTATEVPWCRYDSAGSGKWRQVWYDDSTSLAAKYVLVNNRNIAGIGIWALSYESGRSEIWSGIRSAFATTAVDGVTASAPSSFTMYQNYPNPFNPTTAISYELEASSNVSLKVFDMLGREVATLVDATQAKGTHTVQFHASNNGMPLPSGGYLYRLQTDHSAMTRQMLLVR